MLRIVLRPLQFSERVGAIGHSLILRFDFGDTLNGYGTVVGRIWDGRYGWGMVWGNKGGFEGFTAKGLLDFGLLSLEKGMAWVNFMGVSWIGGSGLREQNCRYTLGSYRCSLSFSCSTFLPSI